MKKLVSILLAAAMLLSSASSFAEGNYTDEMKFDDGVDLSAETGADSVERQADHVNSPYFTSLDYYNMASTDTLTILTHFKTMQQSSNWSRGMTCALMVMEWYGMRGDYTEASLSELRPQGTKTSGTSLGELLAVFRNVGGFDLYSTLDMGRDVKEKFTFDYIQETLKEGDPIIVGCNAWGGHWVVIIGYDNMGTATEMDDVIIVADPYDTTDHNQDGYQVVSAKQFMYSFTFNNYFPPDSGEPNDYCFLIAEPEA